jgi:hypothetical protein
VPPSYGPAQDVQRHITRQFVRLCLQHLACGGQPGQGFAQQRGLPRPGRAFDPDHLGLASDRRVNARRDRGEFGVAPDDGLLAHRLWHAQRRHRPSPKHDSTRGFP